MAKRCDGCPALIAAGVAIVKLSQRLDRLEGKRRKIGFQATDVEGDRIEQDEEEAETPDELRRA